MFSGDPFKRPSRRGELQFKAADTTFKRPSKRSQFVAKDYTKFIRWSPLKITIAALCIAIPYIGIIVVIASVVSIHATVPFVILPIALAVVTGFVYGIGLLDGSRHQPKHYRKHKRRS